jgi:hypothetical protein
MASQVFILSQYNVHRRPTQDFILITQNPIENQQVTAAWAYALRHKAKGLDLPDHEAAVKLLLDRHPSWMVIEGKVETVAVNLALADQDVAE